jgi:hypothetical protein
VRTKHKTAKPGKRKEILATARRFLASGDVVNIRTIEGQRYRGYVDRAEDDCIRVTYFVASRRLPNFPRLFVNLLPRNIVSIRVSKAYSNPESDPA